ncbi:dihydrofolate reductase-like domain-containing protein [Nemania abortiva]|nr:dihydrofolate reductase-like domain-containing protein [Nemania abortiva]
MAEAPLCFPDAERQRLEPHLPPAQYPSCTEPTALSSSSSPPPPLPPPALPFVTLTFATSLDSALALGPGIRTALSGPQSKAMTHYLRSRHDAICVGVGTAIADDPGLNSRLAATAHGGGEQRRRDMIGDGGASDDTITAHQPRPIVIDPRLRWDFTAQSKVMRLAREGKGLAPYIITVETEPPTHKRRILEDVGGKFITLDGGRGDDGKMGGTRRLDWRAILSAVQQQGLRSIMIEGGGEVINSLLGDNASLVDSVIVTIAPIWLGKGGVTVSPPRTGGADRPVARLSNTTWMPLGDDVVLCGRVAR